MQGLVERLAPTDVVERHCWLFADHWVPESGSDVDDEEQWLKRPERLEANRAAALKEVLAAREVDGVVSLIVGGKAGWWVGRLLAKLEEGRVDLWLRELLGRSALGAKAGPVLHGLLQETDGSERASVLGRLLDAPSLAEDDKLRLLLAAPCDGDTWRLLADREPTLGETYWKKAAANAYGLSPLDAAFMVDRLLAAGRPFMAFRTVGLVIDTVEPALLARVLRAMRASEGDDMDDAAPDGWHVGKAIARVAAEEAMSRPELASLEFAFFVVLEHDQHGTPNLDRQLAESPGDFIQLVKLLYKRDDGQVDSEDTTQAAAHNAWRILHEGRRVPGTADDGTIDGDALIAWIDATRKLGNAIARSVMTDQSIGTLLAASPAGADGHWPHEAVRRALDHVASDGVATGFIVGKQNARGVVMRGPGGDQERALAADFRAGADAIRIPFPFTARALEQLAVDYEHQARRWDGEEQVDRRLGRR